ncbi:MAG TPA: nitrilase-related carbon-nitrogen hydrolase, partial [Chthoniobacterales bacterium]
MRTDEHSNFGYLRVGAASPELRVGDPSFNAARTIEVLEELAAEGCSIVVFPELGLTGYTCADLFFQSALRDGAVRALLEVAEATRRVPIAAVVGVPLVESGRLFNCAAVISGGRVRGIVPKTFLPTSQEYYEERWFSRARAFGSGTIRIGSEDVPAGADLLFDLEDRPSCRFGIEICE